MEDEPGAGSVTRSGSGCQCPRGDAATRRDPAQLLARHRQLGIPSVVAAVDLDAFRRLNEVFGRQTADEVVDEVERRLTSLTGDGVVRVGPDEWRVVLSQRDPVVTGVRIRQLFTTPVRVAGHQLRISAAIGLVRDRSGRPVDVCRQAELAMERAARRGIGQLEIAEDRVLPDGSRRTDIEERLPHAIADGELRVWYQPVVCAGDGQIVAAEALVRWQHPERGLLSPGQFIEAAERTGVIHDLGAWVLEEACTAARSWPATASGLARRVSVNVSPRQLEHPGFHRVALDAVAASGLDPTLLCLEVTESIGGDEFRAGWGELARIRARGPKIAIDDFGTGWASFERLATVSADVLKIDRCFIEAMAHGRTERAIVESIVALAASLDLTVVAEGVETPEQVDVVRSAGCHLVQGYHFGRPQPGDEFLALLEDRGPATERHADRHRAVFV